MHKLFKTAELRQLEKQVSIGEISYSRMVEILNEKFNTVITQNNKDWSTQCAEQSTEFEKIEVKLKDELERWKKLYYSESQMNKTTSIQFGRWLLKYASPLDKGNGLCWHYEEKEYDNHELFDYWFNNFYLK